MPRNEDKLDDFNFDSLNNELDQEFDAEDNDLDLNALQQAIDTSWGRSSTPKSSQFSVKFQLDANYNLIASYCAIVNFVGDKDRALQKRTYGEESKKVTDLHVKAVKERYKSITGKSISTKEVASSEDVEIINMNFFNPKRTAYFRRKTVFSVA